MLKWFFFFFLLLTASPAFSQKNKTRGNTDSVDLFLQQWMETDSIPGALVLVSQNGKIIKERSFGFADISTQSAPGRTMRFETGGITHVFTALAICQLAEAGKLSLDSAISKYIDSLSPAWYLVTVRNLLYHCHGLNPEHYDKTRLPGAPGFRYSSRDQLFHMRGLRLYALAGTAAYYTESAYFLLGLIIQNISGLSYEEYVRRYIFNPAGMVHSRFLSQPADSGSKFTGYTLERGKWIPWSLQQTLSPLECNSFAGIISTAEDLLRLDQALQNNRLVKKETFRGMMEPFILPDGNPAAAGKNSWGMGFSIRHIAGHPCVVSTSVTGCGFFRFPSDNLTVILLTNLGDGDDYLHNRGASIPYTAYPLLELIIKKYLHTTK